MWSRKWGCWKTKIKTNPKRSHSHGNKSRMGHEYCLLSCPHDWCGKDIIGSCTMIMHGLECYEVTNGSWFVFFQIKVPIVVPQTFIWRLQFFPLIIWMDLQCLAWLLLYISFCFRYRTKLEIYLEIYQTIKKALNWKCCRSVIAHFVYQKDT